MRRAAESFLTVPYPRATISLIEERTKLGAGTEERHIELVRWENYQRREAKRVRLDERQRIIWNMPHVETEIFATSRLIIGDTTAVMSRAKGDLREPMPECVLDVKRQAEA